MRMSNTACTETRFNFCQTPFVAYASFIRLHCFGFPLVLASTEQVIMYNSLWLFSIWSLTVNPEAELLQGQQSVSGCSFFVSCKRADHQVIPQVVLESFMLSNVNSGHIWLFQEKWEGRSRCRLIWVCCLFLWEARFKLAMCQTSAWA